MDFRTIADVRADYAARNAGHFFDRDSDAYFSTSYGQAAYADGAGGAYFTTSDRDVDEANPRGSVRHYHPMAHDPSRYTIDTVGQFRQYPTLQDASTAAANLAEADRRGATVDPCGSCGRVLNREANSTDDSSYELDAEEYGRTGATVMLCALCANDEPRYSDIVTYAKAYVWQPTSS